VLDLRLYRVTLLPFAIGLIVVAFSLHAAPAALTSSPTAAGFQGARAQAALTALARIAGGDPAPGSPADDALAQRIASSPFPRGLADAYFGDVRVVRSSAATTAGTRTVTTVIATRAGVGPGIVLIADRGGPGPASGLSATAVLIELANVFRDLVTVRPLTLVSTSGGASGLAAVAGQLPRGSEAAIVIGQPPTARGERAAVVPWSTAGAVAPAALRATVEAALAGGLGVRVGDPPLIDQFARIALPLTVGAQGPVLASGLPAVLATAGDEAGSTAAPPAVSSADLGAFGQSILAATTALNAGPALATAPTRDLRVGSEVLDGWGVRLLAALLLLSLVACTLDVVARARRRRAAIATAGGWVLSFAAPFLLAGLFMIFLGVGGLLPATPAAPVTSAQLAPGSAGVAALVSVGLLFVLAWLLRAAVRRGRSSPQPIGALAALLVAGCAAAFLVLLANAYTALLVIVPLHVWLVVLTRERHRTPLAGAVALVVSLALPLATLTLVCIGLGISPPGLAWTLVLLVAGGGLSLGGLLLASVVCGCAIAAATLLLAPAPAVVHALPGRRGSLGYAGPGSLGGTKSALHR
jgi:hypothetical protein